MQRGSNRRDILEEEKMGGNENGYARANSEAHFN